MLHGMWPSESRMREIFMYGSTRGEWMQSPFSRDVRMHKERATHHLLYFDAIY